MKKSVILSSVIVVMSICSASAQLKYGAGLVLGTKSAISSSGQTMGFGVNARVNYPLEKFDLSGGFTFFLPSEIAGMKLTLYQINADAHYNFKEEGDLKVYGLGGLNMSFQSASIDLGEYGGKTSGSDSKVGLDLGVGAKFNKFFAEGKYDTAYEQLALTVGMNF